MIQTLDSSFLYLTLTICDIKLVLQGDVGSLKFYKM